MKRFNVIASVFAISVGFVSVGAHAFDLKVPGISSGGATAAPTENAGDVVKNSRNSLYSFVNAEVGLAMAMGGAESLSGQQELLKGMKSGDAAASTEQLQTLVSIHESAKAEIDKKTSENAKLDSKNKDLASKSMVEYVKGLVSMKKLASSVQGLAKNPMALSGNLGSITYLAKEFPNLLSSGTSTTSTLFKYLGANGVDLSAAKKEADSLGK